jgi:hypothetical protein
MARPAEDVKPLVPLGVSAHRWPKSETGAHPCRRAGKAQRARGESPTHDARGKHNPRARGSLRGQRIHRCRQR